MVLSKKPGAESKIEFFSPYSSQILTSLCAAGLQSGELNEHPSRQQKLALHDLVARGDIFALKRPVASRPTANAYYFHPTYMQGAFQEAPSLANYYYRRQWLPEMSDHLQHYAKTHEAREIICRSIVAYYNRIADTAQMLPHLSSAALIAAYETTNGVRPLEYIGVTTSNIWFGGSEPLKDPLDEQRRYLPLEDVAANISWILPGIQDGGLQPAILGAFEVSHDPKRVISAQSLFMAGTIACDDSLERIDHLFNT